MDINVREDQIDKIEKVVFGSQGEFIQDYVATTIQIVDEEGMCNMEIYKRDIDYLIKALEKAKELWGGEE